MARMLDEPTIFENMPPDRGGGRSPAPGPFQQSPLLLASGSVHVEAAPRVVDAVLAVDVVVAGSVQATPCARLLTESQAHGAGPIGLLLNAILKQTQNK